MHPLTTAILGLQAQYTVKTSRPLPDSGIREFGLLIIEEDRATVREEDSPEVQEAAFQDLLTKFVDRSCPTKTVKLRTQDKPHMTKELKTIHRQRTREYRNRGKKGIKGR